MFRDAGTWIVVEREQGWALLELRDLPRESVTDSVWIKAVASSFSGLLDLTNLVGTIAVREVDVKTGTVTFATRWTKKG